MFISPEVLYFIITLICGIGYGFFCYRNGLRTGAENAMFYLEDLRYIKIDDESGEISRITDREFKK
jgi:hypothetical protein